MVYSTTLDATIVVSKAVEYTIFKYCLNIACQFEYMCNIITNQL